MLLSDAKQILKNRGYILEADTRERIIATDETIGKIVKQEIEKYGNHADLNHIDVSNVTDMESMFSYSQFNGDISNWDVSNVTNMYNMFYDSKFTGDISNWDVSNVTDMRYMFNYSQFNGDISKWNFNKAVDVSKIGYEFTDDELSELEV